MKVLIVDDSKPILMLVSNMLEELGHEPATAANGLLAKEYLEQNKDVDIVLLDWNMPEMNGLEFLLSNVENKFYDGITIMMTTENTPDKISQALENGASEYIMKPFSEDILQSKIEMVAALK